MNPWSNYEIPDQMNLFDTVDDNKIFFLISIMKYIPMYNRLPTATKEN